MQLKQIKSSGCLKQKYTFIQYKWTREHSNIIYTLKIPMKDIISQDVD